MEHYASFEHFISSLVNCSDFCLSHQRFKTFNGDKKPLPAMTLCPMMGFKKAGFFFKVKDALDNTLNLNDIISDAIYNDTTSLIYDEPIAQQIGRCFSIKNPRGYSLNDGIELYFKTNYDLKIFIHEKGDELWFSGFQEFPFEVATVTLDITKQQNYSFATLAIKEVRSVLQPKPEMPCIDYDIESDNEHELFSKCCKQNLWKNISNNVSCTIAEMKPIMPANSTMSECSNSSIAENVYWTYDKLLEKFLPKTSEYNCPIPCRQTSYQVKLKYFHQNNVLLPSELANKSKGHFTLYTFFPTFTAEEKIESLECDLASLLVSAGGNLGLFLGFSCLSVMITITEWLLSKYVK